MGNLQPGLEVPRGLGLSAVDRAVGLSTGLTEERSEEPSLRCLWEDILVSWKQLVPMKPGTLPDPG